ncbi:hypothetical protein [Halochromatium glycolicum]|nr:hypothetical protein [Halochromatium glycolicum]
MIAPILIIRRGEVYWINLDPTIGIEIKPKPARRMAGTSSCTPGMGMN